MLPGRSMPQQVGQTETLEMIRGVGVGGEVVAVTLRNPQAKSPGAADFHSVGCVSKVVSTAINPRGMVLVLQGVRRVSVLSVIGGAASVVPLPDTADADPVALAQLISLYRGSASKAFLGSPKEWEDFVRRIEAAAPEELTWLLAANMTLPVEAQVELFAMTDGPTRVDYLTLLLSTPRQSE